MIFVTKSVSTVFKFSKLLHTLSERVAVALQYPPRVLVACVPLITASEELEHVESDCALMWGSFMPASTPSGARC